MEGLGGCTKPNKPKMADLTDLADLTTDRILPSADRMALPQKS
jgi:hypothetical protein